ncbi:MAG: helix-turn-helix transcriptional regulator [Terriglobales bacterium]|jgi:transcriptional regulator with XRE-family HTH domain
MRSAGEDLRKIRDRLGLTMRHVESASAMISERHGSEEYQIPPSRLSDIETKGVVPSIYRLYSLAAIYHREVPELLRLYGIDTNGVSSDWEVSQPALTHAVQLENQQGALVPIKMDPGFDLEKTTDLKRMIQQWGWFPVTRLKRMSTDDFIYAHIGYEDLTMYPILQPGTLVQVDQSESRKRVVDRQWRSEYDKPIYLVETRDGLTCCWCHLKPPNQIVLMAHPLSPVQTRVLKCPQEAEVLGRVVGIAMRIGGLEPDSQEAREFSGSKTSVILSSSGSPKAVTDEELPSIAMRKKLG